jgi:hypothetical protein
MGGKSRDSFVQALGQQRKASLRDKSRHDATLFFKGPPSFGVTVMSAPPALFGELKELLPLYCQAKKHQLRADLWLGLGLVSTSRQAFDIYVFGSEPWEEDPVLDEVVEDLGLSATMPTSMEGAKKLAERQRHRND